MPSKLKVTGLVFKIDATDGEKWVKFVAMQQDSAILIYDLSTIKGTVANTHLLTYKLPVMDYIIENNKQ